MVLEDVKNRVLNDIVDVLISNIENEVIKESDISPVADYVLGKIDTIKNEIELDQFLSDLAERWPMFGNISAVYSGEMRKIADEEVASGVLHLAQHGKIDEALGLAKSATQ